MTQFTTVYNRFLGKITDDMYLELTPEDTIRDLQNLLLDAIPGFEFPRCNLYDNHIEIVQIQEDLITEEDFVIGVVWNEEDSNELSEIPKVLVERSYFNADLSEEEINILALLMK